MIESRASVGVLGRLGQELKRRQLCRWALACLMLLYGLAIFAPLLAGDRPYILKAVDYRSYDAALRTLAPVAASVERLIEAGSGQPGDATQAWPEALAAELGAAEQRVELLRAAAPTAAQEGFSSYLSGLRSAVAQAERGELSGALAEARGAKELARELRVSQRAQDPKNPAAGGQALQMQTSYPLLETLSGLEVFCMLAWSALLLHRLWSAPLERLLAAARPGARRLRAGTKWLLVLAACSLLALLWGATLGGSPSFESAPHKAALEAGDLVAERVLFPPLAFGFAESHLGEIHRPPTWTAGARREAAGLAQARDPILGAELAARVPVEVRRGEPGLNSPWRHPLGTDSHGRDLLVRLLFGARVSLAVGLIAALLVLLIGTALGALAGYYGGRTDFCISRLIEVVQCFPAFFLILLVLAYWDLRSLPPLFAIVLVMALVRWTGVARLARAEFLRLRGAPFVLAARAAGASDRSLVLRQILPNALGPPLVAGTFLVASGILTESALSFLGFGVAEPIPSWGSLINDSRSAAHWWIQLFPGLCIFLTVVSFNLLGEALRDALDPKLKL